MILAGFAVEEWRKNIGEKNLLCAREVAFGAIEILRHDAEIDVFRAEDMADLPEHLVDANIGAGVARAVVAGEEKFEFFAGLPAGPATHHPLQAGDFDEQADP
jgi:hypothetical protein